MSKSIKLVFGEDIRRRPLSENISFDAFKQDIMSSYNLQNGTFVVKYQDRLINNGEDFLNILHSPITTIKFDIERKIDDLYEDVPVKEVPKPTIQPTQTYQQPPTQPTQTFQQPQTQPERKEVSMPKMPSIFSALFGMPPTQNQNQPQQTNPLSMIMGMLPSMMGLNNMGGGMNTTGGLGQGLSKNLPNIFKILTEELPKDKLQELIITIIQSIPRDQLINILRTALSSPTVQESIISTLMSSLDKMVEKSQQPQAPSSQNNTNNNNNQQEVEELKRKQEELKRQEEELRKQEETKRRIEELKRQQEEIRRKQEEELRKQEEQKRQQEELLLEQRLKEEEMKRRQDEEEQKRKVEEFKRQQENLQKQYEEQRKLEEQKRQEELKRQHEELLKRQQEENLRLQQEMQQQEERRRQLEQEELKRKQEEEQKRQEEIKRQQEENHRNQLELQNKLQHEQKIQQFMLILQNNGIPYECYRNAEEMGLIETHGIEKVTQLLIKHRGNVELVANELFN